MDPMQPIQPNQPGQNPEIPTPPPHDPSSLESFIRQSSAEQSWVPVQPLFQSTNSQQPQVIEKIVYQKQKVHGFFRTLTILALVVIGFLMLLETLHVFSLNINGFDLHLIYPVFILFSSIVIWSYKGLFGKLFWLLLFLIVVGWFFVIGVYTSLNPSTATKFGSYVSYPSSTGQYTKLYLNTLVTDLTLQWKKIDNLMEGNYWSDRKLLVFSGSTGNYQYYSLQEETNLNLLQNYYSVFSLWISSTQPLYLYVKNLLALQKIDLSATLAKTVKLHAGAMISDIIIDSALQNLDVESALADITLHLPKEVGVKLTYKHYVWQLELADFEQKWPWYFESTNIATAQKVVNITMRFGGARTKIVWDK